MLTTKDIRSTCSTATYANGQNLCKPGNIRKVSVVQIDDHTIKATALVKGNFGFYHTVTMHLDTNRVQVLDSFTCNCYEIQQQRASAPCRHCVALALALACDGDNPLGLALEPREVIFDLPQEPAVRKPPQETSIKAPVAEPAEVDTTPAVAETVQEVPQSVFVPAPVEESLQEPQGDPSGMDILFGHLPEQENEPLVWNPNDTSKVFHTNTGIIGTMGTGKTQFTKSLITQLYRQQKNNFHGTPLGILIFDYKGDYNTSKKDFVEATGARVLSVVRLPFNPLAIVQSANPKPMLPVHTANAFTDTISRAYRLGVKQQNSLYSCIDQAYKNQGIIASNPETWNNLAPTFDMVYDIYINDPDIPKNDSLEAAMQDLHRFSIFESNPYHTASLFDVLKGVVVIDLSGYDEKIQSLIVGITLDQFYAQMHSKGSSKTDGTYRELTRMILVDEADNFMRKNFPSLKKIMKEGREFGVGTILSTQCLDHFTNGDDDYSRYIMTWVVHNVSDLKRSDVEYIFRTTANSADTNKLYEAIKNNDRFHSIVKIGNADPVHVRDKAFFELLKDDQN